MSWITQIVENSGISQFLGQEAQDEDIRSFFIESVTNAVDGSTRLEHFFISSDMI